MQTENHKQIPENWHQLPVRVHTFLMRHPWARLWYFLRGLDQQGSGLVIVPFKETASSLRCKPSTLWEWLRKARAAGAIHQYSVENEVLRVRLASLTRTCRNLKLENWGTTATILLGEILNLRAHASAIATQNLQSQSRYAAKMALDKNERAFYKLPDPFDIVEEGKRKKNVSAKPDTGTTNISAFLLYVGGKRAFVSKGYVPYGASQKGIGDSLGISGRTIRRHLSELNIERRQICQAKDAYRTIKACIEYRTGGLEVEPGISWKEEGLDEYRLFEPNGNTSSRREKGFQIKLTRFFSYYGKVWIYRCNLYVLSYELRSMRVRRSQYKRTVKNYKSGLSKKTVRRGVMCHKN